MTESLMDAHINKCAVQHQGAQMTLDVFEHQFKIRHLFADLVVLRVKKI